MLNSTISILDGVCYSFSIENERIVLLQPHCGFKLVTENDINKLVPYLAKNNISSIETQWEMGIGKIIKEGSVYSIEREKIVSSSDNNQKISFTDVKQGTFYILANEFNFSTGFNNALYKNTNFTVGNTQAVYIIDNSQSDIEVDLIEASENQNLSIQFKILYPESEYKAYVKKSNNFNWLTLGGTKTYCQIISYGLDWIKLVDDETKSIITEKIVEPQNVGIQAVSGSGLPGGGLYSIQYNSSGSFDGTPVYYLNNNLLLGGSGINLANSIIPLSTSGNIVLNNLNNSSDFIVKGSGDKNLFFGYDGKLGINIPSGLRPSTALHIINNTCSDGIRLDNRNPCYSANLTLYHKPSTVPATGSTCSLINMAGKNSVSNQVNYVQLKSRILNSTVGQTSGEFVLSVENSGNLLDVLTINRNMFRASIGSNSFEISQSGLNISGKILLSNFDIDGGIIAFSGLSSDNSPSTSPTPTPSITPTITPTATLTPTPTPTPTKP